MEDKEIAKMGSAMEILKNNFKPNNESLKRMAQKEEPRLLSLIIKDKELLMESIGACISPEHFWNNDAKFLFEIIKDYYTQHNALLSRSAMESIMDSMETHNGRKIDDEHRAAARIYWDKVFSMEVNNGDFKFLVSQINKRHVQTQAYGIMQEFLPTLIKSTENQDVLVKQIRELFLKIGGMDNNHYSMTLDMIDGMDKVIGYIDNRRANPHDNNTVYTGIKGIDDVYHGFEYGSYVLITGLINGGKTALMMNIAFNMAKAGYNVVYVSLEKEAVPFFTRLLSLHALVNYNKIREGGKIGLNDVTYNKLLEAAKDLTDNIKPKLTCVQNTQGAKLSKILADVDKILSTQKVDVLFVDYIGAVGNETVTAGRPDLDDAKTSQRLQAYGREKKLVVITAAQLKTQSAQKAREKSKKEDISEINVGTEDISGSKLIIADADCALGVFLNADNPPTKMRVNFIKARESQSRQTIELDFDGAVYRVSDPLHHEGQIYGVQEIYNNPEVNSLVFDTSKSISDIQNDDNIFGEIEKESALKTPTTDVIKEKSTYEILKEIANEPTNTKSAVKEIIKEAENKPLNTDKDNDFLDELSSSGTFNEKTKSNNSKQNDFDDFLKVD